MPLVKTIYSKNISIHNISIEYILCLHRLSFLLLPLIITQFINLKKTDTHQSLDDIMSIYQTAYHVFIYGFYNSIIDL